MVESSYSPPLGVDTSADRGGVLLIVNIVTLVLSLFSVFVRFHISHRANKTVFVVYKDDIFCYAATVPRPPKSSQESSEVLIDDG